MNYLPACKHFVSAFLLVTLFTNLCPPINGKHIIYRHHQWPNNRQSRLMSTIDRNLPVSDRQSGLTAAILAGPALLAASSIIFSFPGMTMLFLAPLISNLIPDFNEISQEISNNPQLIEFLQSVQNLSQNVTQSSAMVNGIKSSIQAVIDAFRVRPGPSSSAAAAAAAAAAASSSSSSSSSILAQPPLINSSNGSLNAQASNTIISVVSAPPIEASISPSLSSSSSSSSSSSAPQKISSSSSSDPLADLSGGFLSQLAAINDILTSHIANPTDDPVGAFQHIVATTLTSLSKFLFSSKREETLYKTNLFNLWPIRTRKRLNPFNRIRVRSIRSTSEQVHPASARQLGMSKYLQELYSTIRDGLKKYEISESDCQNRLICELNQKAVARSVRTWIRSISDTLRLDKTLESLNLVPNESRSTIQEYYQAMRRGMHDEDCALTYSKCPETIAVEPHSNSLLGKLVPKRRRQNKSVKKDQPTRSKFITDNFPFPVRMAQIPVDHRSNEYVLLKSIAPPQDNHKPTNQQ